MSVNSEELSSKLSPELSSEILGFHSIAKSFGAVRVLENLNLSVKQGEVFGFLGRNGAGKSTAIRIMMGITGPDRGEVHLFGQTLGKDIIPLRQRIGYVAQEQHMYPWMTPRALARFVSGFYPRWDKALYEQLLRDFELPPKRRVGTFSGGMKAKLALSLAVATRPDLLVLDEPTAGMDPVARREFPDLVREQARRDGATTFFSTHLIDEIEAIADRIGIVESGQTMYEGRLEPLRNSIATFSIPEDYQDASTHPGEFYQDCLGILQRGVRRGRRFVILHFRGNVPAGIEHQLAPGWRHDEMSLEDVFIAVVKRVDG